MPSLRIQFRGAETGALVDQLDIRILRELTQADALWPAKLGPPASYREIARRVGVSYSTIHNRIQSMMESGFLRGIGVYVNPLLLGLEAGSYVVEIPRAGTKARLIDRIRDIPGVIFFENFRGSLLGLGIMYEDARRLEARLSRIDRICESERGTFSRVTFPPTDVALAPGDWKLIQVLMSRGLLSYDRLAEELGVPVRTLKRRLSKLVHTHAILTYPRMDYRGLEGGIASELLVEFRSPEARASGEAKIRQRIGEWVTFVGVWEKFDMFRLILPNTRMVNDLALEIGRYPEIRTVRPELVDEVIDRFQALLPYVERRLKARGGSPAPRVSVRRGAR